jgi:hypothetical protein
MTIDFTKPIFPVYPSNGHINEYWTIEAVGPIDDTEYLCMVDGFSPTAVNRLTGEARCLKPEMVFSSFVVSNTHAGMTPDFFDMSYEEVKKSEYFHYDDEKQVHYIGYSDGRYEYRVCLIRFGVVLTAGCREWYTFNEALYHYNRHYTGTGDRVLCQKIIQKLWDLWLVGLCDKSLAKPKPERKLIGGFIDPDKPGTYSKETSNLGAVNVYFDGTDVVRVGTAISVAHPYKEGDAFREDGGAWYRPEHISELIEILTAVRDDLERM